MIFHSKDLNHANKTITSLKLSRGSVYIPVKMSADVASHGRERGYEVRLSELLKSVDADGARHGHENDHAKLLAAPAAQLNYALSLRC